MDFKESARRNIVKSLRTAIRGNLEVCVRINAVGSGLEVDDLNAILSTKSVDAIVMPKVESASDVDLVCGMIEKSNGNSEVDQMNLIIAEDKNTRLHRVCNRTLERIVDNQGILPSPRPDIRCRVFTLLFITKGLLC